MRIRPQPAPPPKRGFTVDLNACRDATIAHLEGLLGRLDASEPEAEANIEDPSTDASTGQLEAKSKREAKARELKVLRRSLAGLRARPRRSTHHFKMPGTIRLEAIRALFVSRDLEAGAGPRALLEQGLAYVGACWAHESLELETPWPTDPTPEALARYIEAVEEELLDHGYSEGELTDLADQVVRAVRGRQRDHEEAEKIAGFFGRTLGASST